MAPTSHCRHFAFHLSYNILPPEPLSHLANQQQLCSLPLPLPLPLPLSTCRSFATALGRRFRHGGLQHGWKNGGIGVRRLKVGRHGGPREGGRGARNSGDGSGEDETAGLSFVSWYLDMLQKYPLITNSVSAALLNLLGDLICQIFVDQVLELDTKRLVVTTSLGIVLVGPTLNFWFSYLNRLVLLPGPFGSVIRLVIDQFLFSPLFIGVFLCGLVTLEGRMSQIISILQQEWPSVVLTSWQFWIPFQFLNFQFVRPQYQLLAANIAALAWNVIVSFNIHKEVVMK